MYSPAMASVKTIRESIICLAKLIMFSFFFFFLPLLVQFIFLLATYAVGTLSLCGSSVLSFLMIYRKRISQFMLVAMLVIFSGALASPDTSESFSLQFWD